MTQRVVLHVGIMKSGTSALQSMLFVQRRALARSGVLVPGRSRNHQIEAILQGRSPATEGSPRHLWERNLAVLRSHPGVSVLSSELLGSAQRQMEQHLLPDLEPIPVEFVVTVRDLNRALVSMWQETIQNGRSWTWEEYYASVQEAAPYRAAEVDPRSAGARFWRQQDVARIVGRLVERHGAERVTVVTVPPRSGEWSLLPARFAEATGVPLDPTLPSPRTNQALGLPSVLALRRVNELLAERGYPWPDGQVIRKRVLAKRSLVDRADDEPRLALDPPAWVHDQTAATVDALRATGARLVGEWGDLDPIAIPGVRPEDVDPAAVAEAAMSGLATVIAHHTDTERIWGWSSNRPDMVDV